MSVRGKPSQAHIFDAKSPNGQCIYCATYKNQVDAMSLECTKQRELEFDVAAAKASGKSLEEYRRG